MIDTLISKAKKATPLPNEVQEEIDRNERIMADEQELATVAPMPGARRRGARAMTYTPADPVEVSAMDSAYGGRKTDNGGTVDEDAVWANRFFEKANSKSKVTWDDIGDEVISDDEGEEVLDKKQSKKKAKVDRPSSSVDERKSVDFSGEEDKIEEKKVSKSLPMEKVKCSGCFKGISIIVSAIVLCHIFSPTLFNREN
jgi:hypothetical protein